MSNTETTYSVLQVYESGKSDGWYLIRHTTLDKSVFLKDIEAAKFSDENEARAFKTCLDNLYRKKM